MSVSVTTQVTTPPSSASLTPGGTPEYVHPVRHLQDTPRPELRLVSRPQDREGVAVAGQVVLI